MHKNIFFVSEGGGGYHVTQNHSVFNCQCSFEPFPKMLISPPRCAETEWTSAVWLAPKQGVIFPGEVGGFPPGIVLNLTGNIDQDLDK